MNVLPFGKQVRVISSLVEGCSIRATERLCGTHRDTIMHLSLAVGEGCSRLHDALVCVVQVTLLQVDEIWSWVGKKQRRLTDKDPDELGDQWTYVGLDATKKAIVGYRVGKRTAATTGAFARDLRARITNKPQITSDGYGPYVEAVARTFGADADYAMLVKQYGGTPSRYVGSKKTVISGSPCPEHISTSYVERENLTMRTAIKRFCRKTNAFSKRLRQHCAAVALYVGHYNFCRVHETLKATPCMAIGLTERPWSISELVDVALSIAPGDVAVPPAPAAAPPTLAPAPGPARTKPAPKADLRQLSLFDWRR